MDPFQVYRCHVIVLRHQRAGMFAEGTSGNTHMLEIFEYALSFSPFEFSRYFPVCIPQLPSFPPISHLNSPNHHSSRHIPLNCLCCNKILYMEVLHRILTYPAQAQTGIAMPGQLVRVHNSNGSPSSGLGLQGKSRSHHSHHNM